MKRYDVMKHWSEGFVAGIHPSAPHDATKNEHWQAGYSAGYQSRRLKNRLLDEYLVATGREPQAIVRICDGNEQA